MKRKLLYAPDSAPGLPAPVENKPGVAAPAAPAPAAKAPLSSERLQADIVSYLTETPAPATPAAEPAAPAPEPGPEPSPGEEQTPAELPLTPPTEVPDADEPLPERLDARAVQAIVAERGKRRELKGRLEAERDAEKARADALKAELEAQENPDSKRSDQPGAGPNVSGDRLGNHPLIREAREAKAQHAAMYDHATQLLATLDTNTDGVLAELKRDYQLDLAGQPVEAVRHLLTKVKDTALLKHGEAAGHAAALEREAERNLGAMTQQWKGYTETLIPELKDPKSPVAVEHAKTLAAYPWLQQDPRGSYVAQCIAEGHRLLVAKAKRAATPAAAPAKAVAKPASAVLPGASASLPPNAPPANNVQVLKEKFFASGKPEDRQARIEAVMSASQTRAAA